MRDHRPRFRVWILFLLPWGFLPVPAGAEEGMWTFDNPPAKQIQAKYGFALAPQWLEHVRLSSVRFNDGGSGSFVGPRGLILTNHHVALGQLQKVSGPDKDYASQGFYARTAAEEMKCPDLELNVLLSMEDVTTRVQGAVKKGMGDREAYQARKSEIAKIEKESLDATGLRSDVVALYAGGEYWLYRYKKFTDVRLVFAPEQQIAFFGGDPDNFTYPRYNLDVALFRAYENGAPAESPHYLKWNARGAAEGELVFVSGNPGSTERLSTMRQIEVERDVVLPETLKLIRRRLAVLNRYSAEGEEQARQAMSQVRSLENSLKAYGGEYNGLLDRAVMAGKQQEEREFRARAAARPELAKEFGKAWDAIRRAQQKRAARYRELRYRSLRASRIASLATSIVRYAAESRKPDGERMDGYHDSQLESLKFGLLSPAPVYPGMETALLADSLQESLDELGPRDPFVQAALGGRRPEEVARDVIEKTRLTDPAYRKELMEGGTAAVEGSDDPAIALARKVDPAVRDIQKWMEDQVESVQAAAGEKIGRARFAVYGRSEYPDATFTLRLSYGSVRGYAMNGTQAPWKTTFFGLYDRSAGFDARAPYDLPVRYVEGREKLDLSTPVNFVCTCDTIGGNSGSPVINRDAEIVGVIFDGNIESLVGNYVYNEENNRSVAVHTGAVTEALRKLYGAAALADELEIR